MKYPNGSETVYTSFPFGEFKLKAVKHCPCSDGRSRRAAITGHNLSASVQVGGFIISGYVMLEPDGVIFRVNPQGKHASKLPSEFRSMSEAKGLIPKASAE